MIMTLKHAIVGTMCALMLIALATTPALGQTPPSEATGFYHWIEILQGDNPDTTVVEDAGTMLVTDSMLYTIPYKVDRVYVHVPAGGVLTSFNDVHRTQNDSVVGLSEFPDWYYWKFAPGANRTIIGDYQENISHFFRNGTYDATEVNVTDDQVKLQDGVNNGLFTSRKQDALSAVNVSSAKIVINATHPANLTLYLSNNAGSDWIAASNNASVDFASNGSSLMYRMNISGNSTIRPEINNVTVEYIYTPTSTTLALEATYTLSAMGDPPVIIFEKKMMYDVGNTNILVYFDSGLGIEGRNITWANRSDIDPEMWDSLQKPGKDFRVGIVNPGSTFSLTVGENIGASGPDYSLYIAAIIILAIFLVVGLASARIKKKLRRRTEPEDEPDEEEESEAAPVLPVGKDGLVARKESVIEAIKKLDSDLKEGLISKESHAELRAIYKKEAVPIMKELDSTAVLPVGKDALVARKESVIKAIRKLDSDLKEGLISEESHAELRAIYKKEAVQIMKELDS